MTKLYSVSYRGPDSSGRYRGLFGTPGDSHWREVKDCFGDVALFETAAEAQAAAGSRLCFWLNCQLPPLFNRLATQGEQLKCLPNE